VVYIAASVDGHIADAAGSVDWLSPYSAEEFGYGDFIATIGTVVMGRASYDQVLGFPGWPYSGKRTVVLTGRPAEAPTGMDVGFAGGDIASIAEEIAQTATGDVWIMGGADTIARFLRAGCVDALELFVIPVLLGAGIPLFAEGLPPQNLSLVEAQALTHGVVRLAYAVTRDE
jgi:dihydrofolate reductase